MLQGCVPVAPSTRNFVAKVGALLLLFCGPASARSCCASKLTILSGAVLASSHPAPFCALRHSVMPAAFLVGAQDLFSTVSLHLCRLGEAALWLMLH